jgi:hypothetical protein
MTLPPSPPATEVSGMEAAGAFEFDTGVPVDFKMLAGGEVVMTVSPPLSAEDRRTLERWMQAEREKLLAKLGVERRGDEGAKRQMENELGLLRQKLEGELVTRWSWEQYVGHSPSLPGRIYRTKTGRLYIRARNSLYPRDVALEGAPDTMELGKPGKITGVLRARDHMVTEEELKAYRDAKEDEVPRDMIGAEAGDVVREFYLEKPTWTADPEQRKHGMSVRNVDGALEIRSGGEVMRCATFTLTQGKVACEIVVVGRSGGNVMDLKGVAEKSDITFEAIRGGVRVRSGDSVVEAQSIEVSDGEGASLKIDKVERNAR